MRKAFWSGNLKDVDISGRIILKWILEKYHVKEKVASGCECGAESLLREQESSRSKELVYFPGMRNETRLSAKTSLHFNY
jgi:hypothetical protein